MVVLVVLLCDFICGVFDLVLIFVSVVILWQGLVCLLAVVKGKVDGVDKGGVKGGGGGMGGMGGGQVFDDVFDFLC